MAGRGAEEASLAADRVPALEDDDLVAAGTRRGRGGQSGGPGADDHDAASRPGRTTAGSIARSRRDGLGSRPPAPDGGCVSSRPARGFIEQRIGVSAW